MLSIVETPNEFHTLLWGQQLIVHMDHKNTVCGNLSNDGIARWRLLLEEHSPTFVHVKGVDNVVADALSQLDMHKDGHISEKTDSRGPRSNQEKGLMMATLMTTLKQDQSVCILDMGDT